MAETGQANTGQALFGDQRAPTSTALVPDGSPLARQHNRLLGPGAPRCATDRVGLGTLEALARKEGGVDAGCPHYRRVLRAPRVSERVRIHSSPWRTAFFMAERSLR